MSVKLLTFLLVSHASKTLGRFSADTVKQNVILSSAQEFSVRYKATDDLICKGSSGFSGYVDSDDDRHMFFWAVPSRNEPSTDPVILWLSGGPGASGVTVGGFKELGPCWYLENQTTTYNEHSWTNNATVIFVDQPLNAGYSYSSHKISTLERSTTDLHKFLESFFITFPEYSHQPFYIAGQSYGGSYVPALAARIVNAAASSDTSVTIAPYNKMDIKINLQGIMIGNGLMNVTIQRRGYYELGCTSGPFGTEPLLDANSCAKIADVMPTCEALESACALSHLDLEVCKFSNIYCHDHVAAQISNTDRYPYDLRRRCKLEDDGSLECEQPSTHESWMNSSLIRKAFGVDEAATYIPLNYEMEADFDANGEIGYPSDFLINELLGAKIRVLIYVGNMDWFCNAPGMRLLVDSLEWSGQEIFKSLPFRSMDWLSESDIFLKWVQMRMQQPIASVRSWSESKLWGYHKKFDMLSFFEVDQAGHAAAGHRPQEVMELINRFISGDL